MRILLVISLFVRTTSDAEIVAIQWSPATRADLPNRGSQLTVQATSTDDLRTLLTARLKRAGAPMPTASGSKIIRSSKAAGAMPFVVLTATAG